MCEVVVHIWSFFEGLNKYYVLTLFNLEPFETICLEVKVSIKWSEVKLLSRVRLFATPWTVAYQDPLSMGFSRQEYWSGLPFPSPGDLPNPGIKPGSPALQAGALSSEPPGKPIKSLYLGSNVRFLDSILVSFAFFLCVCVCVWFFFLICIYKVKLNRWNWL